MEVKKKYKSGFVAIIGRPNAGKSTLLNVFVGERISIVSDKPQTTRNRITGILTLPDAQVIFLDTPGLHRPRGLLNEYMVKTAKEACEEVDIVLFMVEANRNPGEDENEIIEFLKGFDTKVFLVINKTDLVRRDSLLPLIDKYSSMYNFSEIIPVSSLRGENVADLKKTIVDYLPDGPQYYPEDEMTEQPERFIAAEIIREKIFRMTKDEVPYSTAVLVEEMKERGDRIFTRADIYVERDSHKGIIIGAKGQMLKKIGQAARRDIERLLGAPIYLELWVKVKSDWREKPGALKEMGYK